MPTDDELVEQALDECARFFDNRDEMNAAVHCGEVRWSPLTVLVRDARAAYRRLVIDLDEGENVDDATRPNQ